MAAVVERPLLDAYFERIGLERPPAADTGALRRLHAAHVAAIPFENLDILLGRGISLNIGSLRAKLVDGRRGGYCFEQNTLFAHVLTELGFDVTPREARVRAGNTGVLPRTHMVLTVRIDEGEWLADVGFGADGLLEPVAIAAGERREDDSDERYRVVREGAALVLQARSVTGWTDLYVFLPQPVYPVDFEVGNWYTSTHPESRFVRTLTAQRTTREVRYVLRYPTYSEIRGDDGTSRAITRAELVPLLREVFLIDLPADVRFDVIDGEVAELAR